MQWSDEGIVLGGGLDIGGAGPEEVEVLVLEKPDARRDQRDKTRVGPFDVEPVLAHAQEREVVLGQPGKELLAFLDGWGGGARRVELPFLDDAADYFNADLAEGLYVATNVDAWSSTSYYGEHDFGVEADFVPATPADYERFGFASPEALERELAEYMDESVSDDIPEVGITAWLCEKAREADAPTAMTA